MKILPFCNLFQFLIGRLITHCMYSFYYIHLFLSMTFFLYVYICKMTMLLIVTSFQPKNNFRRSPGVFALLETDENQIKISIGFFSIPKHSLYEYLVVRNTYIITESSSLFIISSSSYFNFLNVASVISPSNTEFCTHVKYFLQVLRALATLFSPTS